jgi:hypothetical protein
MANKASFHVISQLIIEVCVIVLIFTGLNFFLLQRAFPKSSINAWFLVEGITFFVLSGIYAIGYHRGNFISASIREFRNFAAPDEFRSYPRFAVVTLIAGVIMLVIYFLT